jgi:hypothetical protein
VNEIADASPVPAETPAIAEIDFSAVLSDTFSSAEPVVVRGLAAGWPAVAAARSSTAGIVAYLERFDRGAMAEAFVGPPEIGGRFFYADGPAVFNFERRRGPFKDIVEAIARLETAAEAPVIYIGSTPVAEVLPGFEKENLMPLLDGSDTEPRIWIGNRTVVSAHFDESSNLAVVVAGRRRFTLFPPDQVRNLYIGPLDNTVAGQPMSLVDVRAPDLEKFPRFAEALAQRRVAELGPGDAIFIPALWWHHVEALDPFNALVNYWWKSVPPDAGSAFEAMVHGILAIAALPEREREAWRGMFDHYVFRRNGDPAEHLAPSQKGILGEPTPELRARICQFLLAMLSRV